MSLLRERLEDNRTLLQALVRDLQEQFQTCQVETQRASLREAEMRERLSSHERALSQLDSAISFLADEQISAPNVPPVLSDIVPLT